MLFLEMDLQEFLRFESVESSSVTAFESARVYTGFVACCHLTININMMVVSNMLTKVVLALESVITTVPIIFD